MPDFKSFEKTIGVAFANPHLLRQAFTHRSYLNENKGFEGGHNERLEFLGDAVLELVTTEYLYFEYPEKTEGDLTSYRAALVNTMSLSDVAAGLRMNDYLLLSRGEAKDIGRARQYILANTFEALVGALFLDRGYAVAKEFIATNLLPRTEEIVAKRLWQDAKSRFQEMAQENLSVTPNYDTVREEGPDHDKHFTVCVYVGNECVAEGEGKSKQEAEQDAAQKALKAKKWE